MKGDMASFLIGIGARPTNSTLIYAAEGGSESVVRLLLQYGAKVNDPSDDGKMPLVAAARNHNDSVVRELLDSGADVNASDRETGNTAVLQTIVNVYNPKPILSLLIQAGANLNIENHDGDTALLAASRRGEADIVQLLIDNGANLYHKNKSGDDTFSFADKSGNQELLNLLADKKANWSSIQMNRMDPEK